MRSAISLAVAALAGISIAAPAPWDDRNWQGKPQGPPAPPPAAPQPTGYAAYGPYGSYGSYGKNPWEVVSAPNAHAPPAPTASTRPTTTSTRTSTTAPTGTGLPSLDVTLYSDANCGRQVGSGVGITETSDTCFGSDAFFQSVRITRVDPALTSGFTFVAAPQDALGADCLFEAGAAIIDLADATNIGVCVELGLVGGANEYGIGVKI